MSCSEMQSVSGTDIGSAMAEAEDREKALAAAMKEWPAQAKTRAMGIVAGFAKALAIP